MLNSNWADYNAYENHTGILKIRTAAKCSCYSTCIVYTKTRNWAARLVTDGCATAHSDLCAEVDCLEYSNYINYYIYIYGFNPVIVMTIR